MFKTSFQNELVISSVSFAGKAEPYQSMVSISGNKDFTMYVQTDSDINTLLIQVIFRDLQNEKMSVIFCPPVWYSPWTVVRFILSGLPFHRKLKRTVFKSFKNSLGGSGKQSNKCTFFFLYCHRFYYSYFTK